MRTWFDVSNVLTRSANITHVGRLWLCRKCNIVFIIKLPSWQPTHGVDPNWYLTPCASIILKNLVHKMLLNCFEPISMSVTPLHLLGSLRFPIFVTGTTGPSCHSSKSASLCQNRLRCSKRLARLFLVSDLNASGGTSASPGEQVQDNHSKNILVLMRLTGSYVGLVKKSCANNACFLKYTFMKKGTIVPSCSSPVSCWSCQIAQTWCSSASSFSCSSSVTFSASPLSSDASPPSAGLSEWGEFSSSSDVCGETGHCMGRFALFVLGSTQNLYI